ncbi:caspase family protein [Acuticoccus mangrovi]|uniref:Caspase family p20 domain-containing protein n=1 Tax=Acuticoccus mangrovi TaxID=2796142 RepID=A0A934ICY8_9HYPH|nr:caspase family protein [Acuticoccus mangrovi]MBJ3774273.1 hypothetical protein [Acuticoccus mangrovi]
MTRSCTGHLLRRAVLLLVALCLAVPALVAPAFAEGSAIREAIAAGDKRYALLVGVGAYTHTPPVKFVKENLDAVERAMRDVLFVPEAHIRRISDPDAVDLLAAFGFESGAPGDFGGLDITQPDAELFVYFVGHGSRDLRAAGTSSAAESEGFLLARNSRPNALSQTAYSYDTLIANLDAFQKARFPEGRVVLFLESCFSGETNDGQSLSNTMGPMIAPPVGLDPPESSHDVITFAAAGADTPAYWDEERGQGLFTDALVKGITGRADAATGNSDGTVTLDEMASWLSVSVPARARALSKGNQRPQATAITDSPLFALYKAPAPEPNILIEFEVQDFRDRTEEVDRHDMAALRTLHEELVRFMDECGDACRPYLAELVTMRDELANKRRRCEAATTMVGRLLERNAYDRIAAFDEICAPAEIVRACVGDGTADSPACRCLADSTGAACGLPPEADCSADLAKAREAALSSGSLEPIAAYEAAARACVEADPAAVAAARADVCAAGEAALSGGTIPPGLAECPFAADAAAKADAEVAMAEACRASYADARAVDDPAPLARFIAESPTCPQRAEATAQRDQRIADAMAAADAVASDAERQQVRTELTALRQAFGTQLSEAALARIDDTLDGLDRVPCAVAAREAQRRGTAGLEDFVASRPECPEVREARASLDAARCTRDFDRIDATDTAGLFNFIDTHSDCSSGVWSAKARLEQLATQCLHEAGRVEDSDPRDAISRYRQCDSTFGFELSWVGKEATSSIDRLQRLSFCRDSLASLGNDKAALERFVQRSSGQCPAEALIARQRLANLTPPSPDGNYLGTRGYTDRGRKSPNRSCLSRYEFNVTVRNGVITFYSDNRSWRGDVGADGSISLSRSGISPPPNHETWINARIQNGQADGTLYNAYCGGGYFRLTRQ